MVLSEAAVELALNLVCLLIACGSAPAWTIWRRRSDSSLVPQLGQGLVVVGSILAILLPAISITDDLAQAPFLAEGMKLKDVLKAPEHFVQFLTTATFIQCFFSPRRVVSWEKAQSSQRVQQLFCWSPNIEKRPPPSVAL